MKKILILFISLFVFVSAYAQQTPVIGNYLNERYLLNPAAAGISEQSQISLFAKNYFMGFTEKNPGTQMLSFTTRNADYGIGLSLINDYFGNTRNTSFSLAYAYHLKLNDDYAISIALAPKISQFSVNQSEYVFFDDNDDAISGINESKLYFDADFGVAAYSDELVAGLGVKNLLQPNVSLGGNTSTENRILRQIFLNADYRFAVSHDFMIQPAIYTMYSEADLFFDVGSRFIIKEMFWAGLAYKSAPALGIMFGVNYSSLQFGYAYDYNLALVSGYSKGTHEIVLTYAFGGSESSKPKL
jgi:type IX secretion system PorP/SprF family membrane protein